MAEPWLIASDIDNTLTGDPSALRELGALLTEKRRRGELVLFLVTGRRLDEVLPGFEDEWIPRCDGIISQVGTEIYLPPYEAGVRLAAWDALLRQSFRRDRALQLLADIPGLRMQPAEYNTRLKVSCFLDSAPDPDGAVGVIRERVEAEPDTYRVVWSSSRDLDIIPAAAGKGNAIKYLIDHLDLTPRQVIVAGDSGNDRSMFEAFRRGIIVANAQAELLELRDHADNMRLHFANKPYAAGVTDGLRHFGVL